MTMGVSKWHWGKWVPQGLNAQVKTSSGSGSAVVVQWHDTGRGITMPIHSRLHGTMNWRGFLFLIATTIEVRLRWHGSTVEKKEQSSGVRDSPLCSATCHLGRLTKAFPVPVPCINLDTANLSMYGVSMPVSLVNMTAPEEEEKRTQIKQTNTTKERNTHLNH